jgi:hypothetical protein
MLQRQIPSPAPIHPAVCSCFDCRQRDPIRVTRDRRQLRAWAVLSIALAAVFYGAVLASIPHMAAAFGWSVAG